MGVRDGADVECVEGGLDERCVSLDPRPGGGPQDENDEASPGKVLLVPQLLIGGHEHLKARSLSSGKQDASLQRRPAALVDGLDLVPNDLSSLGNRCSLIEEDLPEAAGDWSDRAS
jgi:hypothetical protein